MIFIFFSLQLHDCAAKLADTPGNGEDRKNFHLVPEDNASNEDGLLLEPGELLKIQFYAKTGKKIRGVGFTATLVTNQGSPE